MDLKGQTNSQNISDIQNVKHQFRDLSIIKLNGKNMHTLDDF